MKSKIIVATALVAILLSIVATAAVASSGALTSNSNSTQNGKGHGNHGHPLGTCNSLTVGQTLTASGLTGRYVETTTSTTSTTKGTAAGTFAFVVAAKYAEGCTLSIKSGTFALGPTTYAVTGGLIVFGRGSSGVGSGTTSTGTFLINLNGMHQSTTSSNIGAVAIDFKTGTSEFLVNLHTPESTSSGGSG
jgi:hypothetical protein